MERRRVGELVEEIADNHFSYLERAWAPLLFKDEEKPEAVQRWREVDLPAIRKLAISYFGYIVGPGRFYCGNRVLGGRTGLNRPSVGRDAATDAGCTKTPEWLIEISGMRTK